MLVYCQHKKWLQNDLLLVAKKNKISYTMKHLRAGRMCFFKTAEVQSFAMKAQI